MIIPAGFSHCSIFWAGTGLPLGAATTFGINNLLDQPAEDVATIVANAITNSTLVGNLVNTVTTTTIRVKNGPNDTGEFHEGTMTIVGGNSNPGMPPNVAYLIKKSTLTGGKRGRGRMYLPGVPEAAVDVAGTVAGATVSAINTDLGALLADLISVDCPMTLLHSDSGLPSTVSALTIDGKVATQRRRVRR